MLRILVLGSAAGGGFPQWNCRCDNCRAAWAGEPGVLSRTQSSLAVSADGDHWVLLNASPDLRQQIEHLPALHPRHGARHSPIVGAVLTNGDVDHVAGLLTLRESHPLAIYATSRVHRVLRANSIFNVLDPGKVDRRDMRLGETTVLHSKDGADLGIRIEPIAVPGKVALWLEDTAAGPNFGTTAEDTVALRIGAGASHFYYVPGCAAMTPDLANRLRGAALVFFDGTLWTDDEMKATGTGVKTGGRMGHMNMSGAEGSLAAFEHLGVRRKIYIHINNTNPALLPASPQRQMVEKTGWEVAYDGLEITL